MSERNTDIETGLDILKSQISKLERRFETTVGQSASEEMEKAESTNRPIGILINELPNELEVITARLQVLTTTFDNVFVDSESGNVEPTKETYKGE